MSALEKYLRITPFLWFDNNAEDVVNFYLSVFENSSRLEELHDSGDDPVAASILTIAFGLDDQKFTAINGGPMFKFTEAVSFVIRCDWQGEVDHH
jgi:predicted 3-demethylubiquinone-9 3-methyltransferase (glyoxalase superfamily)